MKKTVLLFLFCCITLLVGAADAPKYFAVWLKNGQRIDLLLSEKPNVRYNEGTLKFEASNTSIEYNASEVKEFTFEDTGSSGIQNLSADGKDCIIHKSGDIVSISGALPYAKLSLYNASGTLIQTVAADGKGTVNFSLDPLGRGAYILRIATTTFKIMKK